MSIDNSGDIHESFEVRAKREDVETVEALGAFVAFIHENDAIIASMDAAYFRALGFEEFFPEAFTDEA